MKAAVFAGTTVDTRMGVELLKGHGLEAIAVPMSSNCDEQSNLQYFSQEALEELFITKSKEALSQGADIIVIYCNSLSAAVDYEKIKKLLNIEIFSPLDTYKNLPGYCKNIAILAANGLSAYTIDRIIQSYNQDKNTIPIGNISIVRLIEKGLSPAEIVKLLNLKGFLSYLEKIEIDEYKIDSLILGCTHFPYIKKELEKYTSIRIIDPADKMLETILHTKEKKEYAKENTNNDR
ncbi:aspartate/glutamate racemase family protein [Treponema sp. OMZ 792]|uniref:aspartate/glutamate racemase family protein n=1 Tax=unclassified Treponema TaxID=2638727 RepID=UPI0020A5732A|nr:MULTISPECIES: aspartate/glutamate racemase family protein [unclassified Treponema]UTC75646.1 aspartate/glutamate racemase family protein [Treponema sp. OMZ 792]UTC78554.1 racemase [Treponema sp. OMZ 799]UTC79647.1 racemase [Treponema sp. OMZ 798]